MPEDFLRNAQMNALLSPGSGERSSSRPKNELAADTISFARLSSWFSRTR